MGRRDGVFAGWTVAGRDALRSALAASLCRHRGHDWRVAQGRPDDALAALWRPVVLCGRCGQLDVGQREET